MILIGAFCIYPLLTLLFKVSWIDGGLSGQYFEKVFKSSSTQSAFFNTIIVSFGTALLSCIFALPISWLLKRTDLPYVKFSKTICCLPYAVPPYIGAIAWISLANPTNGFLNELLFGTGFFNIYSHLGLIFVMSCFFYTLVLLNLLNAFDRLDPSLEEAARISGAAPRKVFMQITLPLILPSLTSGFLLVFLASMASFGVPALIGTPGDIFLITTKIYTLQKMGSFSGIYQAGALSVSLLLFSIMIVYGNLWIQQNLSYKTISGKSPRPSLVPLKKLKWPIFIGLYLCLFILFGLPILSILVTALSEVPGKVDINLMGFANFKKVFFEMSETSRALTNSSILAVSAAFIGCILGFMIAFISTKTQMKGRKFLTTAANLPFTTPGTVVALAFILAFSQSFFGLPFSLYNTSILLIIVYVVKYLSLAINVNADGLEQIDNSLAEAARVSGANWFTTLRTIWFPLLRNSIFASWFLILMPCFSELTMTILLAGPGTETVGTLLFQLQEYSDASGGGSAVLSLVVVGFVISLNFLIKKMSNGAYGL